MYNNVCSSIVQSVMKGMNGTIFAYGQTSSGKTFTMQGDTETSVCGVVQESAKEIFDFISGQSERSFVVRASYIEIYNEVIRDLLRPSSIPIKIREDRVKGIYVESHEEEVRSVYDVNDLLKRGEQHRHIGVTNMNAQSSRSHTVIRLLVESTTIKSSSSSSLVTDENEGEMVLVESSVPALVGILSLVDLAGSESVKHTAAEGERLREGGNINKSLLALSQVIAKLSESSNNSITGTPSHVNFRDSKLTRILQPSLAGNTKTAIIVCCTPAASYNEETKSSLRFATRAKTLKTRVRVNKIMTDAHKLIKLQKELSELRKQSNNFENPQLKEEIIKLRMDKQSTELEYATLLNSVQTEKEDSNKTFDVLCELLSYAGIQGRMKMIEFLDQVCSNQGENRRESLKVLKDDDIFNKFANFVLEGTSDEAMDSFRSKIVEETEFIDKLNGLHTFLLYIVENSSIIDSSLLEQLLSSYSLTRQKLAEEVRVLEQSRLQNSLANEDVQQDRLLIASLTKYVSWKTSKLT